ncbi:MAG: hypothetical protein ACLVHV_03395 [Oscillospiraceae bacterium]
MPTDPHPFGSVPGQRSFGLSISLAVRRKTGICGFTVLVPKKACVGICSVEEEPAENAHLLHAAARRAGKAFFQPVPARRRASAISSVAGGFFGWDTGTRFVFLPVHFMQAVGDRTML